MKTLIALLISLPNLTYAHCPISFEVNGETYCTKIEWLNGETKVQGNFKDSNEVSPQLILEGEVPQKWIYSRAEFLIWKDGDSHHAPQQIEDFRIFPYMNMENGHHHSTSYDFKWIPQSESYQIKSVAFQEMPGCWSYRWTTAADNKLDTSEFLTNVVDYKNLNHHDNKTMADYCINPGSGDDGDDHHHSH